MDAEDKKVIACALVSLERHEPMDADVRERVGEWAIAKIIAPPPATEDGKDRMIRSLTSQVLDLKQQLAHQAIVFDVARPRDIRPILRSLQSEALVIHVKGEPHSDLRIAATRTWNLVQELFAAMPAEESAPDSMGGVHIAKPAEALPDPIAVAPKLTATAEEAHATLAEQAKGAIQVQILYEDVNCARFDRIVCEPHFMTDAEPTPLALILEFMSSEPTSRKLSSKERVTYRAYFAHPSGPTERLKNEEFKVYERGVTLIGIAKPVATPVRP